MDFPGRSCRKGSCSRHSTAVLRHERFLRTALFFKLKYTENNGQKLGRALTCGPATHEPRGEPHLAYRSAWEGKGRSVSALQEDSSVRLAGTVGPLRCRLDHGLVIDRKVHRAGNEAARSRFTVQAHCDLVITLGGNRNARPKRHLDELARRHRHESAWPPRRRLRTP